MKIRLSNNKSNKVEMSSSFEQILEKRQKLVQASMVGSISIIQNGGNSSSWWCI